MSSLGLFRKFPREIRDCIYGHMVCEHDRVLGDPYARLAGLLATCPLLVSNKDILKDVLESWVSQDAFTVESSDPDCYILFLSKLEYYRVDFVTHVRKSRTLWSMIPPIQTRKRRGNRETMTCTFELCCQNHKELHTFYKIPKERLIIEVPYYLAVPHFPRHHSMLNSWDNGSIHIDIQMGDREASLRELHSAYKAANIDSEADFSSLKSSHTNI